MRCRQSRWGEPKGAGLLPNFRNTGKWFQVSPLPSPQEGPEGSCPEPLAPLGTAFAARRAVHEIWGTERIVPASDACRSRREEARNDQTLVDLVTNHLTDLLPLECENLAQLLDERNAAAALMRQNQNDP